MTVVVPGTDDRPNGLAPATTSVISSIQETAKNLQAAMQIGTALANTIFVPPHFRQKPEECAAAILYGDTIGMDAVTSLQQIHVINGKPGLYARAMVAVVLSHGHKIWTEEAGPTKVVVCGQRKGEDHVERSEWTVERARKAGYTSNKKYDTSPEEMLYARSSGDVARRVAPDALLGMAYSVEELELIEGELVESVAARSGVSRLRSAVPTVDAEPAPPAQPPAIEPAADKITAAQRKKLGNLFSKNKMGLADAMTYTASAIGHNIASSDQLTQHEAASVITLLEAIEQPTGPTPEEIAAMAAEMSGDAPNDAPANPAFAGLTDDDPRSE